MKVKSSVTELTGELENDLALAMLIEKRLSAKIGSRQARDLIAKVKDALGGAPGAEAPDHRPQDLTEGFPVH